MDFVWTGTRRRGRYTGRTGVDIRRGELVRARPGTGAWHRAKRLRSADTTAPK